MTKSTKDTIYIDADDEITAVIDKVTSSKHQIVALVLPKRATVFQSLVNLKLLKRAAAQAKKKPVLITSESGVLPIAGTAGLYTAKTLQSKPSIPVIGDEEDKLADLAKSDKDSKPEQETELDPNKPIGELAGMSAADETIEVDNTKGDETPGSKAKAKKGKGKSKNSVPNFNKFRKKLFIGIGGGLLLIGFLVWAIFFAPSADIAIATNSSDHEVDMVVTLDTGAEAPNAESSVMPTTLAKTQHTDAEKVPATGERDDGEKASGQVRLTILASDSPSGFPTIPAGTGVSTGNLTYITRESVTLDDVRFSPLRFTGDVRIDARDNGAQFNIGPGNTFAVSGFPAVVGNNSQPISGGESDIKKVVAEKDIETAVTRIENRAVTGVQQELESQLTDKGAFALVDTMEGGEPRVTSSPNVDSEGTEVTVNAVIDYTMFGINPEDFEALVEAKLAGEVDFDNQSIIDNGLAGATVTIEERSGESKIKLRIQATVTVGVDFDQEQLKHQVAGKKLNETEEIIRALPGVEDVQVDYSPFWVSKTPSKTTRITITVDGGSPE